MLRNCIELGSLLPNYWAFEVIWCGKSVCTAELPLSCCGNSERAPAPRWDGPEANQRCLSILVLAIPSWAQLGQDGHLKIIILIELSLTCHNTKKKKQLHGGMISVQQCSQWSGQFGAFGGYSGGSAVENTPTVQDTAYSADVDSIPGHLHNHHSSKDTEPSHHPRNFPHIPLPLITTPSILDSHWHERALEFHINKITQYARFSTWHFFCLEECFLYLSTLLTVSVVQSLFITNKYSIIWIYQNLFIYAHVDGCLGHVHLGAIMNCTAVCKSLYKHMFSFLLVNAQEWNYWSYDKV